MRDCEGLDWAGAGWWAGLGARVGLSGLVMGLVNTGTERPHMDPDDESVCLDGL